MVPIGEVARGQPVDALPRGHEALHLRAERSPGEIAHYRATGEAAGFTDRNE